MEESMEARIVDAVRNTWFTIAEDIFNALAEDGEKDDMSQEEVLEIVLDSGHLEYHGDDAEAIAHFRSMERLEREKILGKALPERSWC